MKKYIFATALLLILTIVILLKMFHPALQKNAQIGMPSKSLRSVAVDVSIIEESILDQTINAYGNFVAKDFVQIASEISGIIRFINLPQGKNVAKGQLLIKLHDDELIAELNRLNIEEKIASEKESRKKRLLEIKALSLDEYEDALHELEIIRANKAILKTKIAKTEIRAPFSGLLGLQSISIGAMVNPGMPLFDLVKMDPIYLDFYLPEELVFDVSAGIEINFKCDDSNRSYPAKILASENQFDKQTRSLKFRAEAKNPNGVFKPGSFAKISIIPEKNIKGILIPNTCLIPVLKAYQVYLVKDGKVREIEVKTGKKDELHTVITNGLKVGDSLITSGLMNIRPGTTITVNTIKADE